MDTPTADDQAAGAPGVVLLGGKEYLASPVTDASLVAVRNWAKAQNRKTPQQLMLESLAKLPPDQAKAIAALPAALRADAFKTIFPALPPDQLTAEEAQSVIVSLAGCRFIAWMHLKPPLNPGLAREALDALITEDNYLDVFSQLNDATGLSELANKDADLGNSSGRLG